MKLEVFAERLKYCRKIRNITQEKISQFSGISRSTFANYETGLREPDLCTLTKISKFLNVSTDYLLGLSEDQTLNK